MGSGRARCRHVPDPGGQPRDHTTAARLVVIGRVVANIRSSVAEQEQQWQRRFGDDVDSTAVIPTALEGHIIDLEGQELRVIDVAQGDISPSTVIHIPSIKTVIGGDVVYNRIHMMLALTGPTEWQKWIDSIDLVESLEATTIIAGHKQPDASDQDLETRPRPTAPATAGPGERRLELSGRH